MKKIRVVYMGTPEFSVPALKVLIDKCDVLMVVTQPDKPVGRKKELQSSPVKELALANKIEIFQPTKIRLDYDRIVALQPDLIITCAYGQIIPKELLDCPKYGAINIHASLLPKYRGSAPINWAIINGEEKTGITLMYMDEHMDTGNMIKKVETSILPTDTYGSLYNRLSEMGAKLLEENLDYLVCENVESQKQNNDEATLAPMIKRETELIDFDMDGQDIINKIRGLNPNPYAYFVLNNEEIKVSEASFTPKMVNSVGIIVDIDKKHLGISCKNGIIYLLEVKPAGKKLMPIGNYLNGVNKDCLKNKQVG